MATASLPHNEYLRRATYTARVLSSPPTVVGHSGAGAFLPSIRDGIETDALLCFVDAVIPPKVGAHSTPVRMRVMLDEQTDDGLLRPWLAWWPSEVVGEVLPDPNDRDELAADMPRIPRSFYDVEVDVPFDWSKRACAYLRLSAAYDSELDEAVARHWPTATLDSNHLGTHTDPDRVLAEIVRLADQAGPLRARALRTDQG